MKKSLLIILCFIAYSASAQPLLRQYMFNMTSINPAFSGSSGGIEGTVLYQHQWAGFKGAPRTIFAQLNAPVGGHVGLGFNAYGEMVGARSNYNFTGMFAYKINFKRDRHLSLGIQGAVQYAREKGSDYTTTFPGDEIYQQNVNVFQYNAGAGIAYYDKHLKIGFSVPQLISNISDYGIKQNKVRAAAFNFNLNAAYNIHAGKEFFIEPMFVIRSSAYNRFLMDIDVMLKYKHIFWIAPFYRINTAFGGIVGFGLGKQVKLSYAFEAAQSPVLMKSNAGTHEIMLGWNIAPKQKVTQSPRYF